MALWGHLIAFCAFFSIQFLKQTDCQGHSGTHFLVAMPFTRDLVNAGCNLELVITNSGSLTINVTVTSAAALLGVVTVVSGSSVTTSLLGSSYMLPETGVSNRTLELTSSADFSVHVQATNYYDGYMALPMASWGLTYTVATVCWGPNATCQLAILAGQDFTKVTVKLPSSNSALQVDDRYSSYTSGTTMTQVLMRNAAWVIPSSYEMSGGSVSSNASIGVLAGAQWTSYQGGEGAVTEQLPPCSALGTEFVSLRGGIVRVVTTEPNTTLHISNASPVQVVASGQWWQTGASESGYVYIRADRPVLVVQFGHLGGNASRSFPYLVTLTPRRQFLGASLTVVLSLSRYLYYGLLLVTRDKYLNSTSINGATLPVAILERVDATDFVTLVVKIQPNTTSQIVVTSGATNVLALYILASGDLGATVLPLAANFRLVNPDKNCASSVQQKAGDMVDNDCDGEVDEDDCTVGGTDCKLEVSGGERSIWGTKFVAIIPEYIGETQDLNITLALTTLGSTMVKAAILFPNATIVNVTVNPSSAATVAFHPTASNILTGNRSSRVIRVQSDAEIGASFLLRGLFGTLNTLTTGSMRLYPEDTLNREYYVVTACDPYIQCHFQIVGIYPSTALQIHLQLEPPGSSSTVFFEGSSYGNGDIVYTEVNEYEALQVACTLACTMTGSRVSASKPVAVFVFSNFTQLDGAPTKDHLMEQLPPVAAYGSHFVAAQSPGYDPLCDIIPEMCHDLLVVVASQPRTTVRMYNRTGGVLIDVTLTWPGKWIKTAMDSSLTQIVTDKPVLVVQVLPGNMVSDLALLVVPHVGQFMPRDAYFFQSLPTGNLVAYTAGGWGLVLGVGNNSCAKNNVTGSGQFLDMSYILCNISSSAVFAESSAGVFGGYHHIYEVNGGEITSVAFTLERTNVACDVSKPLRGDGLDNDCDGFIDEEPCLFSELQDVDNDGRFNEDCDYLAESTSIASSSSVNLPTVSSPSLETSSFHSIATTTSSVSEEFSSFSLTGTFSLSMVTSLEPVSTSSFPVTSDMLNFMTTLDHFSLISPSPFPHSTLIADSSTFSNSDDIFTSSNVPASLQSNLQLRISSSLTTTDSLSQSLSLAITAGTDNGNSTYSAQKPFMDISTVTQTDSTLTYHTSCLAEEIFSNGLCLPVTPSAPSAWPADVATPTVGTPWTSDVVTPTTSSSQSLMVTATAIPSTSLTPIKGTTTIASSSALTVTSSTTEISPQPSYCACGCPPRVSHGSVDSASMSSLLSSIVHDLTVSKDNISAVRRKKISMPDERRSAQTMGYIGVVVIVTVILGIVVLDSGALLKDIKSLLVLCSNKDTQ